MNVWIKSLAALSLLTGSMLVLLPVGATPAAVLSAAALPAPAPAQEALNALAAQPDSPLPRGTKLLSIRLMDGLATVDFSREMHGNFIGGDSGEARTVNAVLRTLGQLPTISRVQIFVAGKPVDSLGGLLSLSDPLPVIRPAAESTVLPTPKRWLHRRPAAPVQVPKIHAG